MRWTLQQLVDAVDGRIDAGAGPLAGRTFGPVTIDSREGAAGGVFVPIVAERDGHEFIAAALEQGASAYLYVPNRRRWRPTGTAPAIAVADTGVGLLDIGRAARQRFHGPVVGITGSVGKTSTKDLVAATVGAAMVVTASARSFNNELGVPLTLANAAEDTDVMIVEMGARGIGHIAFLSQVARPTMGVVTAVGSAHTERFGSLDAVAQAKGELVEALPAEGTAVLNGDDGRVSAMGQRTDAEVLLYGIGGAGRADHFDVVAEQVVLDDELRARYTLRSPWGSAAVALPVSGVHQVGNSLAALTVALRLGVDMDDAVAGLAGASASPWRMELATAPSGARILNDAYNANPTSMIAALEGLVRLPATRRIAVLGSMAELGRDGPAEHRRVAALAANFGIQVVAVGTPDYGIEPVADIDAAVAALGALSAGDAVLVKASRVAGLERLAARLLESSRSGRN